MRNSLKIMKMVSVSSMILLAMFLAACGGGGGSSEGGAAPANIMFVLDDSGSMDWEFITSENVSSLTRIAPDALLILTANFSSLLK
jgi:hypothetical protein